MHVRFPLSLKVSLWLVLNLLLVAALAACVLFVTSDASGLDALVRGPAGERAQAAANLLAAELRATDDATAAVAHLPLSDQLDYAVVANESGETRAGHAPELPREVIALLRPPPPLGLPPPPPGSRPPPRHDRDEFHDDAPPRDDAAPPPDLRSDRPGANARNLARGRHLFHVGEPAAWWLIVRMPPVDHNGRPEPVSLVVHSSSLRALLGLLDLTPWFLTAAGVLVVSILFWLPLVRGISRALRQLGAATERIASGDFTTRVPTRRRDELGHLGESVNRMAARLETQAQGQKRFLGDVAHELGSPLGRLQVAVEILEQRTGAAATAPLGDVRDEVQHMSQLVNELMAFTQAGLRPRAASLAPVELAPLLQRVHMREAPAIVCRVEVAPSLRVLADARLLERAVANLLRNAARYAPGSHVFLSAAPDDGHIKLIVEDDGPGVPPEALARLGEPFFRPDEARSADTGGSGLGLAIVRSSIAACGGNVRFFNRTPHGFGAEIQLARAP
ncbi:HAMP domain-containing histidine kinase [Horticoccus luteus]|uniref:histidine kinase n=1 Tax=Horticoccus luteus TaxID=2862869 RepID=A0A8F9TXK8_9BACT|nr:HAMP domain-containing sensor histidine kinase [Horticoccus luteus]QYM79851.1 HAMP domain-containing histidine kinase [Horticoccus luteus]